MPTDVTPREPLPDEFLGDGITASFDGFYIWLHVERDGRNERVALDPSTYHSLKKYAAKAWKNL